MSSGPSRFRAWILVTLLAMATVCAFMVVTLSLRYGGPGGLLLRVRTEIVARRPHPQFVPTPLPASNDAPRVWKTQEGVESAGPKFVVAMQGTAPMATPYTSREGPSIETASGSPSEPVADGASGGQIATPVPVPLHKPSADRVELTGFSHMWQTWNNCGPATLAMNLSYFGTQLDQGSVAAALKPNPDDRNVSPEEMAEFVRAQGLYALVRVNGDPDRLRLFLSNEVPVLIETWLEPEPNDGMGHYRLLTGYDDASRQWIVFDSYVSIGVDPNQPYRGIRVPYEEVETLWAVFNRTYILLYTENQAPVVHSILGQDADNALMWQRALLQARAEVETRPNDPSAWFNLASDLVALGQFEEAATTYDKARVIGLPWRMLWYQFGPFKAYYETGRSREIIALTDSTIKTAGGNIEELYYWKGLALMAEGDPAGARQAWQQALELKPNYVEAASALETTDLPRPQDGQVSPATVDTER